MGKAKMNAQLNGDIRALIGKLKKLDKNFNAKQKQVILGYAAKPLIDKAVSLAPMGKSEHYRYDTPKLAKGIRAPKGFGKKVATYLPGNLKLSVQGLKHGAFKFLENVLFVGPKISGRGKGKGTFGMRRFDAYYAHWVEFGTKFMRARPFMRPAFQSTQGEILRRVEQGVKFYLQKFAQQNKAK